MNNYEHTFVTREDLPETQNKKTLEKYSLGVAHHRVIHLISIHEGITISNLLKKLKVTKQSLNRVIKELKNFEIIEFKKGEKDTRLKHVFLTKKGYKIFDEIFSSQKKRIYNALLNSTSSEVNNFNVVIKRIINEKI